MPWIDRLFSRLSAFYGSKFADLWRGTDLAEVKAVWAEELAGFSGAEIAKGLEGCKAKEWPPTLPEFLLLCRPKVSLEALFHQAVTQLSARRNRLPEVWPSLRLFWAAQRIGNDLLGSNYKALAGRWEAAWHEAAADANKPIPQPSEACALPEPGKTTLPKEEAQRRIAEIGLQLGQVGSERKWALQIAQAPDAFQRVSIEAAIKALKAWGVALPQALLERAQALCLDGLLTEQAR